MKLNLTRDEVGILINSLMDYRNNKLGIGIDTTPIDDLLIKLVDVYKLKCPLIKKLSKDYAR